MKKKIQIIVRISLTSLTLYFGFLKRIYFWPYWVFIAVVSGATLIAVRKFLTAVVSLIAEHGL